MIYAQTPARRSKQVLGDLAVLGWVVVWVVIGRWLHGQLHRLAAPGRTLAGAGHDLADSLTSAGRRIGELPLAGGALEKPFRAAASAGRTLEQAGLAQQEVVSHLALWLPLLVAGPPVVYAVARRLAGRLRWMRQANAAVSAPSGVDHLDLLALRALARRPMSQLRRLGPDPVGEWRRGNPETVRALAELELADLGLRVSSSE